MPSPRSKSPVSGKSGKKTGERGVAASSVVLGKLTKADIVASALRHQIAVRNWPPGTELPPEAEILKHFKVSRPPLREALRMLESEGLISISRGHKGGARVVDAELGPVARAFGVYVQSRGATMEDLFVSLAACEAIALRELAQKRTQEVLIALAQIVAAQEFCKSDRNEYKTYEVAFRRTLLEHCSNEIIRSIGAILTDVFQRHMTHVAARIPPLAVQNERLGRGVAAKRRLVETLSKGDADAAETEWRNYLKAYNRLTAEFVGDDARVEYYSAAEPTIRMVGTNARGQVRPSAGPAAATSPKPAPRVVARRSGRGAV